MRKIFLVILTILSAVLFGGIFFGSFVFQKPTIDTTTKPNPSIILDNPNPYAKLCEGFQNTIAKIPCDKAVGFALEHSPGKVQKISLEPVSIPILSSSGAIEKQTPDMWLIDIVLTKPYFDDKYNKQISVLQIGIRTDEHNFIYEKPIE